MHTRWTANSAGDLHLMMPRVCARAKWYRGEREPEDAFRSAQVQSKQRRHQTRMCSTMASDMAACAQTDAGDGVRCMETMGRKMETKKVLNEGLDDKVWRPDDD